MITSKKINLVILLSILFLLLPNSIAEAKERPLVGVSTIYEDRKTSVEISVFIKSDEKIASGSFDVEYDESLLKVIDSNVNIGEQLSSYLTSSNGASPGKVSLAFSNATGEVFDGTLLTFKGTLTKSGEIVKLNMKNVQFYDENGKKIDIQLLNGEVKPFKGKENKFNSKVAKDRAWTIHLSNTIKESSLNKHTVQVRTSTGKLVDVNIKKRDDTSFTVAPKSNYSSGTYTLEISEQLLSANGRNLKEPIRHVFTVQ